MWKGKAPGAWPEKSNNKSSSHTEVASPLCQTVFRKVTHTSHVILTTAPWERYYAHFTNEETCRRKWCTPTLPAAFLSLVSSRVTDGPDGSLQALPSILQFSNHRLLYFILIIIFVLQIRVLKNQELKLFPQGHSHCQKQDLSPSVFIPSPGFFILD